MKNYYHTMAQINLPHLGNVKKPAQYKPPVPARPKNLVVLNSKTLPKPPDNFLTGNVACLIKGLGTDDENKKNSQSPPSKSLNSERVTASPNSDEEDIDGYLEPVSLSISNMLTTNRKSLPRPPEDQNCLFKENGKVRPVQNNFNLTIEEKDKSDVDHTKQHIVHSHRPLPLPPVTKETEITSMPWYKNVDRKRGEELLKDGIDGYFLVRPSSKEDTFLTLTLWFHNRLYNIPIRKRRDGKYALGTPKANEQCFESVQEMVSNFQSEKLLLYSNGAKAGRTLLTTHPP